MKNKVESGWTEIVLQSNRNVKGRNHTSPMNYTNTFGFLPEVVGMRGRISGRQEEDLPETSKNPLNDPELKQNQLGRHREGMKIIFSRHGIKQAGIRNESGSNSEELAKKNKEFLLNYRQRIFNYTPTSFPFSNLKEIE